MVIPLPDAVGFVQGAAFPVQVLTAHRPSFPLAEAAAAHRLLESRQSTGKLVLLR